MCNIVPELPVIQHNFKMASGNDNYVKERNKLSAKTK